MKYKALILDLDGTTIPNRMDGVPSQRVVDSITKARDHVTVCTATGRTLPYLENIFQMIPFNGPCILNNGTYLYDPMKKKIIEHVFLPTEYVSSIYSYCRTRSIPVYINIAGKHEYIYEGDPISGDVLSMFVAELEEPIADDLRHDIESIDGVACHKISSWKKQKIDMEISSAQASKLHGIQRVTKLLNLTTHDIIGVGDSYNDFPLLMACGLKIAMGNAVPELKAIADFIAPSVDEDGVATVIEKFILPE